MFSDGSLLYVQKRLGPAEKMSSALFSVAQSPLRGYFAPCGLASDDFFNSPTRQSSILIFAFK
jgi:hypothetical protein